MNGVHAHTSPFPAAFHWGAATSAFQIEGATDADGRTDSIWDTFCRVPGAIVDATGAARACDHYRRWPEDLDIARDLGLTAYRFSVAWPRIQPALGSRNQDGIDFYRRLVDGMRERGLAPFLTLYHWDLPQYLQDRGGWSARETVDRYVEYARIVTDALGDEVASIATFNETYCAAHLGYGLGIHAPGLRDPQQSLNAAHHQLLAHGRAIAALRVDGVTAPLGMVLVIAPVEPASDAKPDRRAAGETDLLLNRLYLEPLFAGGYPDDTASLLGVTPPVHDGDLAAIATPMDFLGINYYTRQIATSGAEAAAFPPGAEVTDMGWEVYHPGLTDSLVAISRRYPDLPPIYVTESGCACPDVVVDGRVDDPFRVAYLRGQIAAIGRAMAAGVDVRGYFVWSLLDNFEWAFGMSKRFGLVHVDAETQRRTIKSSGHWYRDFIAAEGRR